MPFKQADYRVTGSVKRSILICPCSRLTSSAIEAGSLFRFLPTTRVALLVLFIDRLNDEVNIGRAFVAGSLSD